MNRSIAAVDPLMSCTDISAVVNTLQNYKIYKICKHHCAGILDLKATVHERTTLSSGSRCAVYRSINHKFAVHGRYKEHHSLKCLSRMDLLVSVCLVIAFALRREDGIGRGGIFYLGKYVSVCALMHIQKKKMLWRSVLCHTLLGTQQV